MIELVKWDIQIVFNSPPYTEMVEGGLSKVR